MGAEADRVATRLERGCRCFAVCGGERVVAYGWLSAGPEWIGEAGLEIRPGVGEAYIWNCVTLTPHRRQGMFAALVRGITEQAHGEGLTRLWIASLAGTAERAIVSARYIAAMQINVRTAGPLRWVRVVPPGAGDGLLGHACPGLRLRTVRTH